MLNEELIKSKIKKIEHAKLGLKTMVCCLTLENGYEVIGSAACVDPLDFDDAIGKELSYKDAENNVWKLEGYLVQQSKFNAKM